EPRAMVGVGRDGGSETEFEPVSADPRATDLLFVGELRMLKGVDVLIAAMALLAREGTNASLTIVGEGPDRATFEAAVKSHGLANAVRFIGAKPARAAFTLGRRLVVPSRAESPPYIVLEAAAAGVPLIVTKVGGIPEIFGPDADELLPPADPVALARALNAALKDRTAGHAAALALQARVRTAFSVEAMTDGVLSAYRAALA